LIKGEHGTLYLQNAVYGAYVNGTWLPVNSSWEWRNGVRGQTGMRNVTIMSLRQIDGNLPVPWDLVSVSIPGYYSPETGLFRTFQPVVIYTVFYGGYNGTVGSPSINDLSREYLKVKIEGDDRMIRALRSLAINVTAGASTDYQKVLRLVSYLKSHYTYGSTSVPRGVDPVYYFLFVSHRGICVDFNAALVVLSRLLGIPARLVTGYLVLPDQNVVTSKNAHAWAQIYLRGRGWVRFDATGGSVSASSSPPRRLALRNVLSRDGVPVNTTVSPNHPGVYVYPVLAQNNSLRPIVVATEVKNGFKLQRSELIAEAEPNELVTLKRFNLTIHAPEEPGVYYVNVTRGATTIHIPVVVGRRAKVTLTNVTRPHDQVKLSGRVVGVHGETSGSVSIVIDGKTVKKVPVVRGRFSATVDLVRSDMSGGKHELYTVFYAPGYLPSKSRPVQVYVVSRPALHVHLPYYVRAGSITLKGDVVDGGGRPAVGRVEVYVDGNYVGTYETDGTGRFSIPLNLKPGTHVIEVNFDGSKYVAPGRTALTVDAIGVMGIKAKKERNGVLIYGTVKGTSSIDVVTSMGTVRVHAGELRLVLKSEQPLMQVLLVKGSEVLWHGSFTLRKIGTPPSPPAESFTTASHSGSASSVGVRTRTKEKMLPCSSTIRSQGSTGGFKFGSSALVFAMMLLVMLVVPLIILLKKKKEGGGENEPNASIWLERDVFATGEDIVIRTNGRGPVMVDGVEVGQGPEVRVKATPGTHRVEFNGLSRIFRVMPVEKAVVELYWKFLSDLSSTGIRTVAMTAEEVERELEKKVPNREHLRLITRMFESVRYGNRSLTISEFVRFVDSMKTIEGLLRREAS